MKMPRNNPPSAIPHPPCFVGIEGGATHTTAVLMNAEGEVVKRAEGGPCNLRLIEDSQMVHLWEKIHKNLGSPSPAAVGAFLAGCRVGSDEARILRNLKKVWSRSRYMVGNDTHSGFSAAFGGGEGIILICGTGSIVRARRGKTMVQIGGWGHVGGDGGSGYWMGRQLVRGIFHEHDEKGSAHQFISSVLAFLGLNTLEELVQWSLEAPKEQVASLTKVLFRYPSNSLARQIFKEATQLLATDTVLAARRAGFPPGDRVKIALHPGIAKHQPLFRKLLSVEIKRRLPGAEVFLSETEGAVGAARLAAKEPKVHGPQPTVRSRQSLTAIRKEVSSVSGRGLSTALTEQRNPNTMDLNRRSIPRLVKTMLDEESRTIPSIRTQARQIEKAIGWIVSAFKRGGRLFYIGAGTSGRVGVLDASECPPTYGCDPDMVQGIMAGGWRALYQSMESTEDDADYGKQTVGDRGITKKDILIGIAASGSTPFVLGALQEANSIGSKTVLLTFNPNSTFRIPSPTFLKIAIPTGPEVVTGSTRLKAGTATKLVLNMFTTISMIRLGKVQSNLMVDVDASCEKLHDRAARILSALRKISPEKAWLLLEQNGWNLKALLRRK